MHPTPQMTKITIKMMIRIPKAELLSSVTVFRFPIINQVKIQLISTNEQKQKVG